MVFAPKHIRLSCEVADDVRLHVSGMRWWVVLYLRRPRLAYRLGSLQDSTQSVSLDDYYQVGIAGSRFDRRVKCLGSFGAGVMSSLEFVIDLR